ncbi:MAG TPA: type II toxin-antitoxin system RelE/ParE family toxin [Polyangiaceae bacterium]|nr:type II toxin-antitoxin system RelE/ParE family toxin [Polyangiaceae bacterium]
MTPFQLDEAAAAELVAAGDWYRANAGPEIATRFVDAIDAALTRMSEGPQAHALLEEWRGVVLRRILVQGFPFQVVYGMVAGTLWVFAVAHLHRRPGYWHDRVSPT